MEWRCRAAWMRPRVLRGLRGTDGPTTPRRFGRGYPVRLRADSGSVLDNDAYHALQAVDGLIVTGGTGTNVNDVSVLLMRK